ncbi:MAG: glycosyltransferase family 1 protein [Candidatus Krumholzibacteriota bacterium]
MNRRPRVILEALQVRPNPTGTGRGILDLCAALAEQDRGLDFSVLTTRRELFHDLDGRPGWRVVECPRARGGAFRKAVFTQFMLPGLVKRLGGDLLHCLQFLVPLRCPVPLVATVHDLAWRFFPETIEEPRLSYYRWLVPRSLAKADAVVANSRATASRTVDFFPQVGAKIHVTLHGTPRWVRERSCAEKIPDQAAGRPYFLFVGTLEPRKNLSRLLDAYESFLSSDEVRAQPPDSVPDLVLVGGRGWKESRLRTKIAQLEAGGRLTVVAYCGLDELWNFYCRARALVFPSLDEGFGLPILEAMAAGLPVLTSDRSGTAEVAGGKALLVNPENTAEIAAGLANLAFDEDLRRKLATGGRTRARELTWSRTAEQTVAVYHEMLDIYQDKKGLPAGG